MAKLIVENGFLSDEPEKSEYDRWVPGTVEKEIPVNLLKEHPQNYEIVGHIDNHTRAELLEDIKQNGIREPLQVWYNDGKLFVVSGNERLSIAKYLKFKTVKCVKVEFKNNDEVLRFIYAVNKHRKQVKTGAVDLLLKLFPVDKYPLLYADLRGDLSHGITSGNIDTIKRKKDLTEQRKLDEQVVELFGIKPEILPKVKSQARKKAAISKTKSRNKAVQRAKTGQYAVQEAPHKARNDLDVSDNLDEMKASINAFMQSVKKTERKAAARELLNYIMTFMK